MRQVQPGNRFLVYLTGVLTVLTIQSWQLVAGLAFLFLIVNLMLRSMKGVWQGLVFASPFLVTAGMLGFFHGGGWVFSGVLVAKLVVIVFWNRVVFEQFSEQDLVYGMQQLRVPQIMALIVFFIFRYREVLKEELGRLALARTLRGGKLGKNWFSLKEYALWGEVIGAGLIRSLDRGDRIYQAMRLRGLRSQTLVRCHHDLRDDWPQLAGIGMIAVCLVMVDRGGMGLW